MPEISAPEEPILVSTARLAKVLDMTPRRVQQLATEGFFEKASRNLFDLDACVQARLRQVEDISVRGQGAERGSKDLQMELTAEKILKTRAEQERINMELAARAGQLLESAAVRNLYAHLVRSIADGLDGLPDQMEHAHGIPSDVMGKLIAYIDDLRAELAEKAISGMDEYVAAQQADRQLQAQEEATPKPKTKTDKSKKGSVK